MFKRLENKSIEDSILQVKDSMNRLQATIQNGNTYSNKNIYLNKNYNNMNDSISVNSRLGDYKKKQKISLNNYLDNSKKISYNRKKFDNPIQNIKNNSYITDTGYNNRNNKNENLKSFKTSNNFHTKKNSNIIPSIQQNNYNNETKQYTSKYNTNTNYLSNIYLQKKLNNKIISNNPYQNSNINNPSKGPSYKIKTEPVKPIKKNKNSKNLNDLYKYGEYLTNELKISNDTNTELLENYINLSSQLKSKNKENLVINNKIKQLKEEEQKLNKANQQLKQNYINAQNIIEKNNLSIKNNLSEVQNNFEIKQKKIEELTKHNLNLITIQKNYEIEIKELEKILNDLKKEDIENKFYMNRIKNNNYNKGNEEKEILAQLEEIKLRNSILQKEIEQLEKEKLNYNFIIEDNNSDIINNMNDIDEYQYEEKLIEKNIKDYDNKNKLYINQIKDIENEIESKDNDIKEIQNEINNINQNILEIESKNNQKKEYYFIKNNNLYKKNKLNQLDKEFKNLLLIKEKLEKDFDAGMKTLNKLCNDKKEQMFLESIDNETRKIMEENERIKEENNDIIQDLNDLPNLKEEYDQLNQTNSKLKKELEKYFNK